MTPYTAIHVLLDPVQPDKLTFSKHFFGGNCPDCIKLNIKYSKEFFLSNWVIDGIKPNWGRLWACLTEL